MDVIASCGKKVGVVDHVGGGAIKLTKKDSPDGQLFSDNYSSRLTTIRFPVATSITRPATIRIAGRRQLDFPLQLTT
jgi:Uncharacterized protein conserved in bacteria (DUF2171)